MRDLSRLFNPKTIAVVGGGAWCASIISAARQIGFLGDIIPVHPSGKEIAGLTSVTSLAEIAAPIDAAFIGVNRHATLEIVAQLKALNAGGAICFASGFSEAAAEDSAGGDLQDQLVEIAGDMPILGPNCYGFLNAMDGAGIWPDQHGLTACDSGVAILTQSSNILINLTMQMRGLPVAMVVACGNQAQTSQADIAMFLLDDPRITTLGLHIEGFGDLRKWEALSAKARTKGIPLIAIKSGRSDQAQAAAVSHTASLAGSDAGAQAFLDRLGIRRVDSLPVFLEALKLAHMFGSELTPNIASISCSGGEAALAADAAHGTCVTFPVLDDRQTADLSAALGPMVALANPLDYHTYIWRDEAAMTAAWSAMADPKISLTLLVIDYPRGDMCDVSDWEIATRAAIAAANATGTRYGVVASLPELLPEATARQLMAAGVVALHGLDHTIAALHALTRPIVMDDVPIVLPQAEATSVILSEFEAKSALSNVGVKVPENATAHRADEAAQVAQEMGYPVAIKVLGLAHKTGAQGLALNVNSAEDVRAVVPTLADGPLLVEKMITGGVAEVLIGVMRDPAHGFVLTLAAGGVMTEILADSRSLLVPASRDAVSDALSQLKIAPLLSGFRGKPSADMTALLDAIDAVQSYVVDHAGELQEVEINPMICTPTSAIAADALIRKTI